MPMPSKLRVGCESVLSIACASLALLSTVWPDWIEALTGLDPDQGDGAVEWGLVAGFALAALVSGLMARQHWRRLHPA